MTKFIIVITTIIGLITLDKILGKYGDVSTKQIRRYVMDKSYILTKVILLWLEHFALVLGGVVGGWLLFKRKVKKTENIPNQYMTREEVRSIVKAENSYWEVAEVKEITKEKPKELICPEYAKPLINALGDYFLWSNFRTKVKR
mgnify:FL=1|jgi:hypothetical protein